MEVQEPWFTLMKNPPKTRKTVEGRVGAYSKHSPLIGQIVEVWDGHDRVFLARVKFIRHYDNLVDYITGEGWANVAPHTNSIIECIEAYHKVETERTGPVFSKERVNANGGINAIHLEYLEM